MRRWLDYAAEYLRLIDHSESAEKLVGPRTDLLALAEVVLQQKLASSEMVAAGYYKLQMLLAAAVTGPV